MSNDALHNLHIWNIKIDRSCRYELSKFGDNMNGNVVDAIECGDWHIPFDSYEYIDIKHHLETLAFHEFFRIPKEVKIYIRDFLTDILSFEKGH